MQPFYESPQQVDGKPQVTIFNARWEDVWSTLGLAPKDVALCWADPPYGMMEETMRHASGRGMKTPSGRKAKDWRPVHGDSVPHDPRPLLCALASRPCVIWGGNHFADDLPRSASWWVWDKTGGGQKVDDNSDCELAWTNIRSAARLFHFLWKGVCQEVKEGDNGRRLHPTMKPVALAEWGFERAGLKPGQLVFAPYLGSGPEVRAALNMGLRIIGCEVDADYCRTVLEHRVALAAPKRGQEGQALLAF